VQLIIAEKPSVARDLARVLGVRPVGKQWFDGDRCVITWCVGHLVELEEPAAYDPAWKAWRLDLLPMLPSELRLRPASHARDQLRAVTKLLRDRRFTAVINACDAGREGELIFRYVYRYAGARLPVRRLWVSSLTDEAIRRGFAALRPGAQLDALADAACCRSEADWLVGMNATRAVTVRGRFAGHDALYSIGRVQTPTLAMIVERERAIRAFVPRPYWEISAELRTADGQTFSARWLDPAGAAPPSRARAASAGRTAPAERAPTGAGGAGGGPRASGGVPGGGPGADRGGPPIGRLATVQLADAIVARDAERARVDDPAGPRVEHVRARTVREPPPLLFDLTSLQRTANRRFGWSAQRTLELAQALYERHKLITYPRTDSRHLSSDIVGELPGVIVALASLPEYAAFARPLLPQPPRPSRRFVDDGKVSDHHAIIPTGTAARVESLDRDERRLFDLIVRRFLGAFHPDAEIAITEVWIVVGAVRDGGVGAQPAAVRGARDPGEVPIVDELPPLPDRYLARGRVRVVAGWQAVAGIDPERRRDGAGPRERGDEGEPTATLPPLAEGQRLEARFTTHAKQTTPPARYTEATLLGAMETAGRQIATSSDERRAAPPEGGGDAITEEEMRAAMKDRGLGTPATRAAIIETLLRRGFIARDRQHLVPTPVGEGLIDALPVPSLASAELTGHWEARLARIARGEESRAAFMADIARYVAELVDLVRASSMAPPSGEVPGATPGATPVRTSSTGTASRRFGRGGRPRKSRGAGSAPARRGRRGGARAAAGRRRPRAREREVTAARAPVRASPPVVAAAPVELPCPRCGSGSLITGARGWGCSRWRDGCGFVVWFEAAGRRITPAQLRDLVTRGKTRKARFRPDGADERAGRLVLDPSRDGGAARFEPD